MLLRVDFFELSGCSCGSSLAEELLDEWFELVEFQHVRCIGEPSVGVGMNLKEESGGTESLRGERHRRHEAAVAYGLAVAS